VDRALTRTLPWKSPSGSPSSRPSKSKE
jgi:hypothetical protein